MIAIPESFVSLDNWPLQKSPYQLRGWILWRMANNSSNRVIAAARRLSLPVDEKTAKSRVYGSLLRHPVLRLSFDALEPYASVSSDVDIPFSIYSAHPGEDLSVAVARATNENAGIPFSLPACSAMRAALVHSAPGDFQEYALLLIAHPIIADESSLVQLLEEIDANPGNASIDDAFFKWATNAGSADELSQPDRPSRLVMVNLLGQAAYDKCDLLDELSHGLCKNCNLLVWEMCKLHS